MAGLESATGTKRLVPWACQVWRFIKTRATTTSHTEHNGAKQVLTEACLNAQGQDRGKQASRKSDYVRSKTMTLLLTFRHNQREKVAGWDHMAIN